MEFCQEQQALFANKICSWLDQAANLLYQGPWVAERLSALTNWLNADAEVRLCGGSGCVVGFFIGHCNSKFNRCCMINMTSCMGEPRLKNRSPARNINTSSWMNRLHDS